MYPKISLHFWFYQKIINIFRLGTDIIVTNKFLVRLVPKNIVFGPYITNVEREKIEKKNGSCRINLS